MVGLVVTGELGILERAAEAEEAEHRAEMAGSCS